MLKKSLYFDIKLLQIKSLRMSRRLSFLYKKYLALAGLLIHKRAVLLSGTMNMEFYDASGLGTTQSNIVDFYHDIVAGGVITKKSPLVLDVGANIGQFCNAVKFFFPSASVYSFEPDPNIFKQLERNITNLKNVKLFNAGLGDKTEELPFYIHNLSLMSSFKKYEGHTYDEDHTIRLPVKRLDDVIINIKRIDLLKIDVEGFELNVLKGALDTLQKTDYLLLEVSLGRSQASGTNLALLNYISKSFPDSIIVKFGRPLGNPNKPTCQDVLIKLHGRSI